MWKDIPTWEDTYELNENGEVRNKITGNYIKGDINNAGYYRVCLYKKPRKERYFRHRLVAELFILNPNNLPEVNHKNEIKRDNRLTNLEWCTREYNNNYGTARKRAAQTIKGKMANGKNPAAKKVICINTGEIFECIREAGNKYNIEASHITDCCKGRRKSCGKHPLTKERLKWKYY